MDKTPPLEIWFGYVRFYVLDILEISSLFDISLSL